MDFGYVDVCEVVGMMRENERRNGEISEVNRPAVEELGAQRRKQRRSQVRNGRKE